VHGADKYGSAALITSDVIEDIRKNSSLAPLHNPPILMVIEASTKLLPKVPQIAAFDTGFHQKMPPHAYHYGLPYDFYEKDRIRRYGFHGISHNYVGLQAAAHLKRGFREIRVITCHLGNGASVCAIDHGWSVDTSMGLTPLEGLIMGTRCGDLDPSIVIYLCREKGLLIEEVDDILNRQSGLRGLSGISSDFRDLEEVANQGDSRAMLAVHAFCYRIRKYIGAYMAALGGLDALVFTGGIGEGSAWARGLACQGLAYMGIQVDDILNRTASPVPGGVADISDERSQVKVLVIPTDEARMIARETIRILGYQSVANVIKSQKERQIPIEVSAHHVHLSRGEVTALFGPAYQLTHQSDLSQPGQYACVETVNLVGPTGTVQRVRVLSPLRKQSQVEISKTEEFKLGIKAPIRPSGDLDGSPGVTLEGLRGTCDISQGVICALRHIHMAPEDALSFGLKDSDIVMIRIEGERTLVFGDVLVRVGPEFRLAMHLDTDEANAANIRTGMVGYLIGLQDRR
jgi:acetate kinase